MCAAMAHESPERYLLIVLFASSASRRPEGLTPAGRRVWSEAVPAVRAMEETLLSSLTMAERVAFVKALAAIVPAEE